MAQSDVAQFREQQVCREEAARLGLSGLDVQMYCVNCGSLLYNGNQAGLVCLPCKQAREKKRRRGEEQTISICYCFHCGESYQPHDTSIQHPCCPSEKGCPPHSNVLLPE